MNAARWERIQTVVHAALNLPADERSAFLRSICGDDRELRHAVQSLLDESAPLSRIGRYAIRKSLGSGAMGVVYLAERDEDGARVAIKVVSDAWVPSERRDRFNSDHRALPRLNHPSIAKLYEAHTLADGTPWFAMEYVDGVGLDTFFATHKSPLTDRLQQFRAVCEAVLYAHRGLMIHRDLKPSNILVTADGGIKLLDFGIARQLDVAEAPVEQARTGFRFSTPAYAAPEQLRGAPPDVQTDVYSLGVTLYELVAGERPFELSNRTPLEAATILSEQEPGKPSLVSWTTPSGVRSVSRADWADLDVLCLTAMHKDRRRRYATVEALIRDLDHFLAGEPLEAHADSLWYRAAKFSQRHWRALAAASVVLAIVGGLLGLNTVRLTDARNAAVTEAARTARIQQFLLALFEGGEYEAASDADFRLAALERGVKEADGLERDPAVQAELRQTLGTLYQRLGRFDEAEDLLRLALDQQRLLHGATGAEVGDGLVALGLLKVDQAKFDEAEQLIRDGLDMNRRTLPAGHAAIVRATAALGRVLEERGEYANAIPVLEEAVKLYAPDASTPTSEVAATMSDLANAHFYVGNLDRSQALNEQVIAMNRRLHGERHPAVADDLISLGAIHANRGRHLDAERDYREAVSIVRAWYGADHPETAWATTILAQGLMLQERHAEATGLLRGALAVQERFYGASHPRIAFALNELGSLSLRQNRFAEAESAFTRALSIYREMYDGKHHRVAGAMSNLGSVFLARGEYREAERLLREAVALHSETLSPTHTNTAISRIKLGRVLTRQRRFREAETQLLEGHEILAKQTRASGSWLKTAREELATVYDALEQPEAAQKFRAEIDGGK